VIPATGPLRVLAGPPNPARNFILESRRDARGALADMIADYSRLVFWPLRPVEPRVRSPYDVVLGR
jgi:hypothetical protein